MINNATHCTNIWFLQKLVLSLWRKWQCYKAHIMSNCVRATAENQWGFAVEA